MGDDQANADRSIEPTIIQPIVAPITDKERFLSLDVIRGVALFGILIMNMLGFGYAIGAAEYIEPATRVGADWWSWVVMNTAFEGTQRTLFSLLFGAGVIIMTSRAERAGGISVADIYYRRNIWLIAFGMLNAYVFLWDGDILYYYGIAALFLYPLRNMKPKHLILVGVAGLAVLMAQYVYDNLEIRGELEAYNEAKALVASGETLTDEQQDAIESWEEAEEEYLPTPESIAKTIGYHTGSYWTTFSHHAPDLTNAHGNETYRYMFLDGFSIMVIGMALFKLGFLTLQRSSGTYLLLILLGYGIGLPLSWYETTFLISNNFSRIAQNEVFLTYDIGRLANGIGHLGVLLLFVRLQWLMWLQRRLAAVGQMALSNYLAHSVIAAFIFLGVGLGLYGSMSRIEVYYVGLGIVLFQLIVSQIWLNHFRFGPAEWLWRSLTYMKKQPMKRKVARQPRIQAAQG